MKRMFLIGLLLLLVVPTFAQQKTAYQKKVEAIENKYLQQVGIPLSEINRLRKETATNNSTAKTRRARKIS